MNSPPVVVIGSGIAGLSAALALAPLPVAILSSRKAGEETSTGLAQGGIAAAAGPDDKPEFHAADTIKAGAGLCDPAIVKWVTEVAPAAIEQLQAWGVAFDRDAQGRFDLHLEAAHNRRRVVHADGDGTGAAVLRALVAKARATESISFIEGAHVTEIVTDDRGVTGVWAERSGSSEFLAARHVVLATGGVGALWEHTTNPSGSWGSGLGLAHRAGAALRDLEFVQFHPTAIDAGSDPLPLASESLRGEGAILVNDKGERFMDELAPRDEVAIAIESQLREGRRVFLDARMIGNFAKRFPTIQAACAACGIDPSRQMIPVCPAAHYHMGGVAVNADGQTAVDGLWACGEVASTGLHGANRLASNSMLEGVVFGGRVAEEVRGSRFEVRGRDGSAAFHGRACNSAGTEPRATVRAIMSAHVGVMRSGEGLAKAVEQLTLLEKESPMAAVARMIAQAALKRTESLGAHRRAS